MFSKLEFNIAKKYTKSKRKDGFVSMMSVFSFLGIMLGVATLIIVMSVMTGLREKMMEHIFSYRGHVTLLKKNSLDGIDDYADTVNKLRQVPTVDSAYPVLEVPSLVMQGSVVQPAMIHSMTMKDLSERPIFASSIQAGDLLIDEDSDKVGIGVYMAQKMGLRVGSDLKIVNPQGSVTPFGLMPRIVTYKVGFIFKAGHKDIDDRVVIMPLKLAQKVFNFDYKVTDIEVHLKDTDMVDAFVEELYANIRDDLIPRDWKKSNEGFVGALTVQQNVMFVILSLIVLIAAFNIISSLTMLVQQKTKDIAVLRTIGLKRGSLVRIFFIIGSKLGIWGTAFGVTIGLTLSYYIDNVRLFLEKLTGAQLYHEDVFWLTTLPSKVVPKDVISIVCMSLLLSFLATLYPAWRAAKLDPVEALRYE